MAHSDHIFRAACVQMRSGIDRAQNVKDALALIKEAAVGGAKFVATPEMTNAVDRKASRLLDGLPPEETLEEIAAFSDAARSSYRLRRSHGAGRTRNRAAGFDLVIGSRSRSHRSRLPRVPWGGVWRRRCTQR